MALTSIPYIIATPEQVHDVEGLCALGIPIYSDTAPDALCIGGKTNE